MIGEKTNHELGGEIQDGLRSGRPDRGSHGHQVLIDEASTVAVFAVVLPEGDVGVDPAGIQVGNRLLIESQDVPEHDPEARRCEVAALGKEAVEV